MASAEMVLAMERMAVGDLDAADELTLRAVPMLQTRPASPVALHAIEGVAYGAALHGWRLEYEQAMPLCQWSLERARERGVGFHIVCLLFIRGLGMGNFGRISEALENLGEGMRLSEVNHECYWLPRLPNTRENFASCRSFQGRIVRRERRHVAGSGIRSGALVRATDQSDQDQHRWRQHGPTSQTRAVVDLR